jgi:hypothetical protein
MHRFRCFGNNINANGLVIKESFAPTDGSLLYVDMPNFATQIFPLKDWSCTNALRRMETFVLASKKSKWVLKAFLDESAPSDEATRKWRSRRENEVPITACNPTANFSLIIDLGSKWH